jgi:phospholipid N-methyltransferase
MHFLKEYIKNFTSIGAIAPSSRFLSDKMTKLISNEEPLNILEVGAGTGAFTNYILERSHSESEIFVSELNDFFCSVLDSKFGDRINLISGDILHFNPSIKFDFIICSIPFNSIPIEITKIIFEHLNTLISDKGVFVFFEYAGLPYLRPVNNFISYKKHILIPKRIKRCFTLLNLPPAIVHQIKLN